MTDKLKFRLITATYIVAIVGGHTLWFMMYAGVI